MKAYQCIDKDWAVGWLIEFAETRGIAKKQYADDVDVEFVDVRTKRRPDLDKYQSEAELPNWVYETKDEDF